MPTPPLGWLEPKDRTQEQADAHADAMQSLPPAGQFGLPCPVLAKGESFKLTNFHDDPRVIADRGGVKFTRIHQWTGSCVWAGGTNGLAATISAARCSDNPIVGIIPFTLQNYARSRHALGWDSKGDGSLGSTFFKSLGSDGVTVWDNSNTKLPPYRDRGDEGIDVDGSATEYAWSTVRLPAVNDVLALSKQHLVSQGAECKTVLDVRSMNLNGYGVSFACSRFIGHGGVKGSGDKARVMGKWDASGGHQQYVVGFEEHEDLGPLYLVGNNWPKGTYPVTPSQPVCFVWVTEADVETAMRNYGSEVFGMGRPDGFPAQPELLNWIP